MAKFQILLKSNGQYYFRLKADSGEIVLSSEGYTSKMGCMNGIESVKINSSNDSQFDRRTSPNDKYYFNLKAPNGQIIGTSELYTTQSSRNSAIEYVKKAASSASIESTFG